MGTLLIGHAPLAKPRRKLEIPVIFGFRALVPGYRMDGYVRAISSVSLPASPNTVVLVVHVERKFLAKPLPQVPLHHTINRQHIS